MEHSLLEKNTINEEQFYLLKLLFNNIIPESNNKIFPGASFILESIDKLPIEFINLIINTTLIIDPIFKKSKNRFGSLTDKDINEIIEEFKKKNLRTFNELSLNIIFYYYSNENILKLIGLCSTPPFPDGNSVLEGDLFLLEQVFIKDDLYKKV